MGKDEDLQELSRCATIVHDSQIAMVRALDRFLDDECSSEGPVRELIVNVRRDVNAWGILTDGVLYHAERIRQRIFP